MKPRYRLSPIWLALFLLPLHLLSSCSASEEDEVEDAGILSASLNVPISFSALSKWDEANTRLNESSTGSSVSFEKNDQIGIFAYLNDSETPNFMNNQQATCQADGASWLYSPVKYWPANPSDKLSFYAYSPYRSSEDKETIHATYSAANGLTINYSCQNADIDLMEANATNLQAATYSGAVKLPFQHLLARVHFAFRYSGNTEYHPVVHILQYSIPYSSGEWNSNTKSWNTKNTVTKLTRYVKEVAGTVIDANEDDEPQIIPDFTAYILPCKFPCKDSRSDKKGNFTISLNNQLYSFTPKSLIQVEAGKSYTITFNIKSASTGTPAEGSHFFITSYSIWQDAGETIEGTLK